MSELARLNIGCGWEYREGWCNLDADESVGPDMVADIRSLDWANGWERASIAAIEAKHVLEHLSRYEAQDFLNECFRLLVEDGTLTLVLPDADAVIRSDMSADDKINRLYGGQNIPLGTKDDERRERNPGLFCHRYGYTPETLAKMLEAAGFTVNTAGARGMDMFLIARKPDGKEKAGE